MNDSALTWSAVAAQLNAATTLGTAIDNSPGCRTTTPPSIVAAGTSSG